MGHRQLARECAGTQRIQAIVDAYNQSQDRVEVKYGFVQADSIHGKLLTATIAGVGPDVIGLWNHRIAYFAQQGLIQPLDPHLKAMGLDKSAVPATSDDMDALSDPNWWPYIWAVGFGAELYNEKSEPLDLSQPELLKAYSFVSDSGKRWVPPCIQRESPQVKYSAHQIPYRGSRTSPWSWLESDSLFMTRTSTRRRPRSSSGT